MESLKAMEPKVTVTLTPDEVKLILVSLQTAPIQGNLGQIADIMQMITTLIKKLHSVPAALPDKKSPTKPSPKGETQ